MDNLHFYNVSKKITVASELYASILKKSAEIMMAQFGKPTSFYEGEKRIILEIAEKIFTSTVSKNDIIKIANAIQDIQIDDIIVEAVQTDASTEDFGVIDSND